MAGACVGGVARRGGEGAEHGRHMLGAGAGRSVIGARTEPALHPWVEPRIHPRADAAARDAAYRWTA